MSARAELHQRLRLHLDECAVALQPLRLWFASGDAEGRERFEKAKAALDAARRLAERLDSAEEERP